ncbi:MAG: hypothetical protein JO111_10695 [Caulobacteraceae bacterium]|nr:hypothetical protein [Caulobacteraceae bacterium]
MQSVDIEPAPQPFPVPMRAVRPRPPELGTKSSVEVRHIVFFLDDALDEALLARMERTPERVTLAQTLRELRKFKGSGALAYPWIAKSVEDALRARNGRDYRLLRARVLPNHVHVLIEAAASWPSGDPIHRWKTASSPCRKGTPRPGLKRYGPDRFRPRALRRDLARADEFWAEEDFDIILRTPEELENARRLIDEISAPERPPALPAPDDEPGPDEKPDALPAVVARPPPPARATLDWQTLRYTGPSSKRRDLRWWLDEIGQCAKDLSVLYGAYFLVVWLVWALQHALSK